MLKGMTEAYPRNWANSKRRRTLSHTSEDLRTIQSERIGGFTIIRDLYIDPQIVGPPYNQDPNKVPLIS